MCDELELYLIVGMASHERERMYVYVCVCGCACACIQHQQFVLFPSQQAVLVSPPRYVYCRSKLGAERSVHVLRSSAAAAEEVSRIKCMRVFTHCISVEYFRKYSAGAYPCSGVCTRDRVSSFRGLFCRRLFIEPS